MGAQVVAREDFGSLLEALAADGYVTVGPTLRDGAITLGRLTSVEDLPIGWTDHQDAGSYELVPRDDEAHFGYAVGPDSPKRYLFPPRTVLVDVRREGDTLRFTPSDPGPERYALIGVRACELAAIAVHDKVLLGSGVVDRTYAEAREGVFVVAVNCATAGGTCFCVSMGTGPACTSGYDLVVTEVIDGRGHRFVIDSATEAGEHIAGRLPGSPASPEDLEAASEIVAATAAAMGRAVEADGLRDLLYAAREHPRWNEVAQRCLACANCTMVCPTCFCNAIEDDLSLDGAVATRTRRWDSCFTLDFTALHGSHVRGSTRSRYRQWLTHKVATWHDQFGSSGCVGCGRCITWCPVGIDITEELAALREGDR
jgi:formate hydrogenlyase subunit 6/NADH:ubiquinone oxidoreductase subunit I